MNLYKYELFKEFINYNLMKKRSGLQIYKNQNFQIHLNLPFDKLLFIQL